MLRRVPASPTTKKRERLLLGWALTLSLGGLCSGAGGAWAGEPGFLFLVKSIPDGFDVVGTPIADGETKTFAVTPESEIVDVILPISVGQSGNVVQRSQGSYDVEVARRGETLTATIRRADGRTKSYPDVSLRDAAGWDVRVNLTGDDGRKAAFLIEGWSEVRPDTAGPVIDMFGGVVPLEDGDVSVTTQVSERIAALRAAGAVTGESPITYESGLLFTEGTLVGGTTAEFIIDFGATGSVVAEWFLPKGTEIREVKGTMHSMEGDRVVEGAMQAAGGRVEGFLGRATMAEFHVGDAVFRDVGVNVVEEMPEIGDRMAAGVLGADVLYRADVVSLAYEWWADERPMIRFLAESRLRGAEDVAVVPLVKVQNHLFARGEVNGIGVEWLLDTGARHTVVAVQAVRDAGRTVAMGRTTSMRGLDGRPVEVTQMLAEEFSVGDHEYQNVRIWMGNMPVLEAMGLGDTGGILGNDFLSMFREIEVDLAEGVLRLLRR